MKNSITIDDAAAQLGAHRTTVSRKVASMGLGKRIGAKMILLTPAEVAKLRAHIMPRTKAKTAKTKRRATNG